MEEPQTSGASEKDTPETILEKDSSSEVTADQPETSAESADPPASDRSAAETQSENQLRLFVTLLTVRLMTKCPALQKRSQDEWVTHMKRLVDQTMEGLAITEGFCPDVKSTKKVCKAVVKDLQKRFCSKSLLETVILLQDPVVDAAIVQALQAHVKDLSARLAEKAAPRSFWKNFLQVVAIITGSLVVLALLALIP